MRFERLTHLGLGLSALLFVGFPSAEEMTMSFVATRPAPTPVHFKEPSPTISWSWSFFQPTWNEPAATAGSGAPSDLLPLLSDPQEKLESEFKIPEALRGRVHFWAQIYAVHSTRTKVLHDRQDPSIVYGVLDFTPVFGSKTSSYRRHQLMQRIEKEVVKEFKQRVLEAVGASPTFLSSGSERQRLREFLAARGIVDGESARRRLEQLRFQQGQKDVFMLALGRSQKLLPEMEKVFVAHGLPVGLSRIPFVESSFHYDATSKAQALGIWQFMPRTAKEFIHPKKRMLWRNPQLQTVGAAKMLKRNRRLLPDWGSTITAYNSGATRIARMLKKHGHVNIEGLINSDENNLGFAGRNFFCEVLAANLLQAYQGEWFSPELSRGDLSIVFNELMAPTAFADSRNR